MNIREHHSHVGASHKFLDFKIWLHDNRTESVLRPIPSKHGPLNHGFMCTFGCLIFETKPVSNKAEPCHCEQNVAFSILIRLWITPCYHLFIERLDHHAALILSQKPNRIFFSNVEEQRTNITIKTNYDLSHQEYITICRPNYRNENRFSLMLKFATLFVKNSFLDSLSRIPCQFHCGWVFFTKCYLLLLRTRLLV